MANPAQPFRRLPLDPRQQLSALALVGAALAMMLALWLRHGGPRGEIVSIDRAPPLIAQFHLDVNRAEWPELIQLPGVGRILADRWVEERRRNGPFRSLDDLRRVSGIGPRTLDRLRPYLAPLAKEGDVAGR